MSGPCEIGNHRDCAVPGCSCSCHRKADIERAAAHYVDAEPVGELHPDDLRRLEAMVDEPAKGEDIDYEQYAEPGVTDDPLVQALLTMPVGNRNESGFMLHMAPKVAAHLKHVGYVRVPEWRQTLIRDQLNTAARADCWCAKARKPCPEHDAYDDGILDTFAMLTADPDTDKETPDGT